MISYHYRWSFIIIDDHEDQTSGHIAFSEAERGAVERLAALGFSQERALEAYLACDRKEELAANFLFDSNE